MAERGRLSVARSLGQTVQFELMSSPGLRVPEFRQERSRRARDVQDRARNRWQYAVNTAIKCMSTSLVTLAEADRFERLDITPAPSSGERMP